MKYKIFEDAEETQWVAESEEALRTYDNAEWPTYGHISWPVRELSDPEIDRSKVDCTDSDADYDAPRDIQPMRKFIEENWTPEIGPWACCSPEGNQ